MFFYLNMKKQSNLIWKSKTILLLFLFYGYNTIFMVYTIFYYSIDLYDEIWFLCEKAEIKILYF